MRNTIKAKVGYSIWRRKSEPNIAIVCDGDVVLFEGEKRSWEDYKNEVLDDMNEMAHKVEVFTTVKGNQFIYWRDEEADEDCVTKVEQKSKQ